MRNRTVAIAMRKEHFDELYDLTEELYDTNIRKILIEGGVNMPECTDSDYLFLYWNNIDIDSEDFIFIMEFLEKETCDDFDYVELGSDEPETYADLRTGYNLLGIERKIWLSEVNYGY